MQLYEKILKNIIDVSKSTHMMSIEASKLKYKFGSNNDVRFAFLQLRDFGFIKLIFRQDALFYVELLPPARIYFSARRKDNVKIWIPIAISSILSIAAITIELFFE